MQNGIAYIKSPAAGDTQLLLKKGNITVLANRWTESALGINLGAPQPLQLPVTTRTYTGDQRAPLNTSGTYDWSLTSWAVDGTLTGGVAEANFNDVISGSGGADLINGLGGNDALDGGAGNDLMMGGDGDDLMGGGAGSDVIYGGTGSDYILSATGLNVPQRKKPDDNWLEFHPMAAITPIRINGSTWGISDKVWGGGPLSYDTAPNIVFAGDGNDEVIGGHGDDTLYGGLDNDQLVGQGGQDLIDGGEVRILFWAMASHFRGITNPRPLRCMAMITCMAARAMIWS